MDPPQGKLENLEDVDKSEEDKEETKKNPVRKYLFFVVLLILASLFIEIKFMLFFLLIVFLNAWIEKSQAKVALPTRIEIATTGTILATIAYGPILGLFIALFSRGINTLVLKDFKREHLIMILTYILAALMAHFIPLDSEYLGSLITVVTSLILYFVRVYMLGLEQWRAVSRTISNIIFNVMFFITGMGSIIVGFLITT